MVQATPGGSLDEGRRRYAELDAQIRQLKERTFDGTDQRRIARVKVDGDGHFVSVRLDSGRLADAEATDVATAVQMAFAEARRTLASELRGLVGGPPPEELAERAARIPI